MVEGKVKECPPQEVEAVLPAKDRQKKEEVEVVHVDERVDDLPTTSTTPEQPEHHRQPQQLQQVAEEKGGGWKVSRFLKHFLEPVQNFLPEQLKNPMKTTTPTPTTGIVPPVEVAKQQQPSSLSPRMDRRAEEFLDLLEGAALPLEQVCYAFAYGSGAIPQQGEDSTQKMVDFVLVCNDSMEFHRRNLQRNARHYSLLLRAWPFLPHWNAEKRLNNLYWFQRDGFLFMRGARVLYNTMIATRGRLIKYGVIEAEDLETDLLDWQWLYMAGRLHKPVLELLGKWPSRVGHQKPRVDVEKAIADNRWMATQAALIMAQSSELSMDDFLKRIVCLSYKGDPRMGWAEDSRKVDKLVAGAGDALRQIYTPILKKDGWVHLKPGEERIEQDYSTPVLFHRLQMLPYFVQRDLCNAYYPMRRFRPYNTRLDSEELIYFISHQHDIPERLDHVLQSIVARSSWAQSVKNAWSAGPMRSLSYIWPKLRKGILRR